MEQIQKIAKSREVLRDILDKRNYNVDTIPKLSELEIGKMIESNISDQSAELCNFSVPHSIFSDWNIHIIYYNFPPSMKNISKVPLFKYINENIENNNAEDNIIVILPSNITTAVETYNGWIETINMEIEHASPDSPLYKEIVSDDNYSPRHMTNIQIFNINSLCVNILDHDLVPDHRVISSKHEIKNIETEHHLEKSQFPIITKNDPVSKILGLVPGDLVEITRPSLTSGITKFYRMCK